MFNKYCEICRGDGFIILPCFPEIRLRAYSASLPDATVRVTNKKFSCPECHGGDTADDTSVFVVSARLQIDGFQRENHPEYINYARRSLTAALLDNVANSGHIVISEEMPRRRHADGSLVARIGVASVSRTLTIEQRAARQMGIFLAEVEESARHRISVWGSDYTNDTGTITKSRAMDSVTEAFKERWDQLNKELNP